MTTCTKRSLAAATASVLVCGTALVCEVNAGGAGPQAAGRRAALEVSVMVVASCRVRTTPESSANPLSLACSRGAMPKGFTPRTAIVPAGPSAGGASGADASGVSTPLAPSEQRPILSIHF